jgi:hypothetical protein
MNDAAEMLCSLIWEWHANLFLLFLAMFKVDHYSFIFQSFLMLHQLVDLLHYLNQFFELQYTPFHS